MKAMSLRITDAQHRELQVLCSISGRTMNSEIKLAIDRYIETRRLSPEFQRRLAKHRAEQLAIMNRLAS